MTGRIEPPPDHSSLVPPTPAEVWTALEAGNGRYVTDTPIHPNQGSARRESLTAGQSPAALVFGCGDSRVPAELVFDQGLGDLFIVRTAGHVVDDAVLGSIEYAVGSVGVSLVTVLGHTSCGAVTAASEAFSSGRVPGGYLRDLVDGVAPAVLAAQAAGRTEIDDIAREHIWQTMRLILDRSAVVREAVDAGRCALAGACYSLETGRARLRFGIGAVTGDRALAGAIGA